MDMITTTMNSIRLIPPLVLTVREDGEDRVWHMKHRFNMTTVSRMSTSGRFLLRVR